MLSPRRGSSLAAEVMRSQGSNSVCVASQVDTDWDRRTAADVGHAAAAAATIAARHWKREDEIFSRRSEKTYPGIRVESRQLLNV
ncbi:hypothetical protein Trydic_g20070 [Trypoxylus dichotomus]